MACSIRKLEKRLPSDIIEWYKKHSFLMESKVPTWVDYRFKKEISEKRHFLTLPEKWQREYMKYFWRIRYEGLRGLLEERIETANRLFDEGKPGSKTDRGFIFIRFGHPHYASYYRDMMGRPGSSTTSIAGNAFLIWEYFFGAIIIRYVFKFRFPNSWQHYYGSLYNTSGQMDHYKWFIKLWGPTEEGWELWGNFLYLHKNNLPK